ncbi:hydroxyacylglutathione hydrolase [Acidithiobacillus caldus]|jgi:hydroxyacylglutathione hydrolase|uniref:Hydroxyacylglutathione hydrolase n=4 Tax=Acidithiobacillus caldus TaxID=33059 RepID=A0A1E7YJW9_9PROT|nr:hydroxyacylglutathione hydrolase [Acidithiobacillus caldus]MBU2802370.1 hydroxyacylglutathione hydrolase [Acidithiobacillus caldus]OFC29770.1 hydroxyacylglutathione hydrolase [Acidithiobacillus caldus]OFC35306.1 hydroxyacylglutathione hydrolase [Acidithiobacillus caldus]
MSLTLIPAFRDNYIYLLTLPQESAVWIVDPGAAAPVSAELSRRGLRPSAILCTHHHADHIGGVAELATAYGCPVYGPGNSTIPARTNPLREGTAHVDGREIRVLEVPGHTLDHLAFYREDLLFCGDTLFAGGCGRIFEGDAAMLFASLQKLARLPDSTRVCCAHEYTLANLRFAAVVEPDNRILGERLERVRRQREAGQPSLPSTLGEERQSNPFLRCHLPSVQHAVRAVYPETAAEPVAIFAALRRWKDGFRG